MCEVRAIRQKLTVIDKQAEREREREGCASEREGIRCVCVCCLSGTVEWSWIVDCI